MLMMSHAVMLSIFSFLRLFEQIHKRTFLCHMQIKINLQVSFAKYLVSSLVHTQSV